MRKREHSRRRCGVPGSTRDTAEGLGLMRGWMGQEVETPSGIESYRPAPPTRPKMDAAEDGLRFGMGVTSWIVVV